MGKIIYDDEIREKILRRLESGETLRSICKTEGMPTEGAVREWADQDQPEGFGTRYAQARDMGLDAMANLTLDVAATPVKARQVKTVHTGEPSTEDFEDGVEVEVVTKDAVERSRLHVDTLKWYLSKLAPKRYGDRIAVEHSGNIGIEERLRAGRKRAGGAE